MRGWVKVFFFAAALGMAGCATASHPSARANRVGSETHHKRPYPTPEREPSSTIPWVCEVEASSKIFTGVGTSAEEATRSAKASCGGHFQSSNCGGPVDCTHGLSL